MALYIGLNNITGKIRLSKGEVVDLTDEYLINDLLKANYIKPFTAPDINLKDVQGAINELSSKLNKVERESISLVAKGTKIVANEDINATKYFKVGNYYCASYADAKTLINSPSDSAFMMCVFSPLSSIYDCEETSRYVYRLRVIMNYDRILYIQKASIEDEIGKFNCSDWHKIY